MYAECGLPTPKTVWLQQNQAPESRSDFLFDIRVIGGKNAEIGKWPWIVSKRSEHECHYATVLSLSMFHLECLLSMFHLSKFFFLNRYVLLTDWGLG